MYARQETLDLTLADWAGGLLLRSVHTRLLATLKASPTVVAEESMAPVLNPGVVRPGPGSCSPTAARPTPGSAIRPGHLRLRRRSQAERAIAHLEGFCGPCRSMITAATRCWQRKRGATRLCWSHTTRKMRQSTADRSSTH